VARMGRARLGRCRLVVDRRGRRSGGRDHGGPGIDRDPGILTRARERAKETGLANVYFIHSAVEKFSNSEAYDVIVSRFFLLYQPNPAQTLATAVKALKPGGIILSLETDMSVGLVSHPRVPLWEQIGQWILSVFGRAGIHADMGAKLYPSFIEAGLPGPRLRYFRAAGGGIEHRPLYRHYCDMVRSILPKLEEHRIASREEIQIDTLSERLENAIVASHAQVFSMPLVAAWAHTKRQKTSGAALDK